MSKFLYQKPVILASGSKSRQHLLQTLSLEFEVIISHCDEEAIKQAQNYKDFIHLARELAALKALAVSKEHQHHYVIAADQICALNNQIFDKPGSFDRAVKHLQLLRGKTHQQISACCIAKEGELLWQGEDTAFLTLKNLSDDEIKAYLHQDKPFQSCGAYHYEGNAKWLFSEVYGSDSTIQGLPLIQLTTALMNLEIVRLAQ